MSDLAAARAEANMILLNSSLTGDAVVVPVWVLATLVDTNGEES